MQSRKISQVLCTLLAYCKSQVVAECAYDVMSTADLPRLVVGVRTLERVQNLRDASTAIILARSVHRQIGSFRRLKILGWKPVQA